ncbi:MAG: hypothetical protein BME94_03165 [Methanobacteriales archaeon Met13]
MWPFPSWGSYNHPPRSSSDQTSSPDTSSDSLNENVVDHGNSNGSDNITGLPDSGSGGSDGASVGMDGPNYHVLPISILLLAAYLGTYFLFKKGILNPKHPKEFGTCW